MEPNVVHYGQRFNSLQNNLTIWWGIVGVNELIGVRTYVLDENQLNQIEGNHLVAKSIQNHWFLLELNSNQSKLVHVCLGHLRQKIRQFFYLRVVLVIRDNEETIACGSVLRSWPTCWRSDSLVLGALVVAQQLDLHVWEMQSEFNYKPTWVVKLVIYSCAVGFATDAQRYSNLLDIFGQKSMNLIDVGVSHDIRRAINALLADLAPRLS